ncbi:MAG: prepilin peptidase [Nocardioides sp.]
MNEVLVGVIAAAAAAILALGVPRLIASLPEPEPPALPQDPADDTAYQARLRAEGPKELYADIARLGWVLPTAVAVSALTGFVLGWRIGDLWWALAGVVPLAPVGTALAIIDARTRLLPTRLIWPTTVAFVGYAAAADLVRGDPGHLVQAVVLGLVAYLFYFVLWFIYPAGMGFGDVRLSALLGVSLGWLGPNPWFLGLMGGFFLSAAYSLVLMARLGRGALKEHVPFGPFMLAGAAVSVLVSGWIDLLA